MVDSESACLRGRARPSWAPHADEVDSPRTIGEDVGTTPTGDGEAVSGRWPAPVWRVSRRCGGSGSAIYLRARREARPRPLDYQEPEGERDHGHRHAHREDSLERTALLAVTGRPPNQLPAVIDALRGCHREHQRGQAAEHGGCDAGGDV